MKRIIRALLVLCGIGLSLFAASLIIYYFNLDMKLMAKVQPLVQPWYDHLERRPMLPPDKE